MTRKAYVIGRQVIAAANPDQLPDRATGRDAATARAAAYRLAALVAFGRSSRATVRGDRSIGASLARAGLRLETEAKSLDRRGAL